MSTRVAAIYKPLFSTKQKRPLFLVPVTAGFPSPADDYLEGALDLNEYLVKHKAATFFWRVTGDSMTGVGIHSGDLLIVDRSLEPKDGNVIIAVLDGELTVKRIEIHDGKLFLVPGANKGTGYFSNR